MNGGRACPTSLDFIPVMSSFVAAMVSREPLAASAMGIEERVATKELLQTSLLFRDKRGERELARRRRRRSGTVLRKHRSLAGPPTATAAARLPIDLCSRRYREICVATSERTRTQ